MLTVAVLLWGMLLAAAPPRSHAGAPAPGVASYDLMSLDGADWRLTRMCCGPAVVRTLAIFIEGLKKCVGSTLGFSPDLDATGAVG